jgi:adenylate cyclase
MPPTPWIARVAAVERPFNAELVPLSRRKDLLATQYGNAKSPKVLVISPRGGWWYTIGPSDEAVRRTLERCGFKTSSACLVVAIDNTFVVPLPTVATVTGIYRAEALPGVLPHAREEVARRLAGVPNAWNAVAAGERGDVGIAANARDEQSAVNSAQAECAKRDRNCRIIVLGPFLVQMNNGVAQPQVPTNARGQMDLRSEYQKDAAPPQTNQTDYQKDAARP